MASSATRPVAFDRNRLRLARELKGWTKQRLADAVDVTSAAISQYESGANKPGRTVLATMALALGMPQGFFNAGRPTAQANSDTAHFRSLRSTSLRDRRKALTYASLAWEITSELEKRVKLPELGLPSAVVSDDAARNDIESLAVSCRQAFDIRGGPVPNVVRLLEAHGVVVVRLPVACREVDAFSCTLDGRPIVLLSDDKDDKARSRHDAAHELGHLVMHDDVDPGSQRVERQADNFAAAFLMPAEEIGPQLPSRLDWSRLIELKMEWGVSLASLLYRSKSLGIISDSTYRRGFTSLNNRRWPDGTTWRVREPGDLGSPEQPLLLRKSIELLAAEGVGIESLANQLELPEEIVQGLIGSDDRPAVDLG
jgi:Zn-dependent peptidase ImmA (M78 family)/transcriptional regulator with XRE-family HTH domain